MRIEGVSALVTGGASGLGFATARRLTDLGTSVVIVDLPTADGDGTAARSGIAPASSAPTSPTRRASAPR